MTIFMVGTGAGGLISLSIISRLDRAPGRGSAGDEKVAIDRVSAKRTGVFVLFDLFVLIFSMILLLVLTVVVPAVEKSGHILLFEPVYFLLSFAGGVLIGAEFPLAVDIILKGKRRFAESVGGLNAADLLGGWAGGILGGVILLPVWGLGVTCIFLLLVKGGSILLFVENKDFLDHSLRSNYSDMGGRGMQ